MVLRKARIIIDQPFIKTCLEQYNIRMDTAKRWLYVGVPSRLNMLASAIPAITTLTFKVN